MGFLFVRGVGWAREEEGVVEVVVEVVDRTAPQFEHRMALSGLGEAQEGQLIIFCVSWENAPITCPAERTAAPLRSPPHWEQLTLPDTFLAPQ